VLPVVYLDDTMRGAACAEALVVGDRIGEELGIPVFLYGELTASEGKPGRTHAELRRGRRGLAERIARGKSMGN
jgi:glutamate formiminotransferase / 5-formyltetrahydrofolate cyclo-ligase